jgi:hypothetical protein
MIFCSARPHEAAAALLGDRVVVFSPIVGKVALL